MTDDRPLLELRHYRAVPARVGDWERRFFDVTLPLFTDLGFRCSDVWRDVEDRMSFYYWLTWDRQSDMSARWEAYAAHPTWQAAKDLSERSGPVLAEVERTLLTRHVIGAP